LKFKELENLINSLKGYQNGINFATNSIRIQYFKRNSKDVNYFFWIDPHWRIRLKNKVIQSSYNYPFHSTHRNKNPEDKMFYKWCAQADVVRTEKVKLIEFSDIGDLKITWENGYVFENFTNDKYEPSSYFYDYIKLNVYEVYPGKIVFDKLKKRKK
jgi:hypothetical protein